ncbi:hypothetical protein [Sinisalibacter aestuarii]|uniref:DUF3149 domain-containing protein n=1 Tax=Sinisalibacter aestuarii TaxID=2949426 RepID=A0ABQ5LNH9_9RHOB|nr:hypothetical protein [Sinisalibacter aestuarii]GKY86535.1 hypothetical protein STA1M1_04040 [Sinisalibacter aestuarii]
MDPVGLVVGLAMGMSIGVAFIGVAYERGKQVGRREEQKKK